MPVNPRSLQLTEAYRRRLVALSARAESQARERWPSIEELDTTRWPEETAFLLTRAQTQGIRLTAGYLAAYMRSESGRGTVPAIDSRKYVGLSRDGRPLREALQSPIIGVLSALKEGKTPEAALNLGLIRATRTAAFEVMQSSRDALTDAVEASERLSGWQRNVAGTCAACMALSGTEGPRFEVHPGCQCIPMPKVSGVKETIALPTGVSLFTALSKSEQEAKIGAEAAQLVRDGQADLKDFVAHSRQEEQADFITQKPVEQVT